MTQNKKEQERSQETITKIGEEKRQEKEECIVDPLAL